MKTFIKYLIENEEGPISLNAFPWNKKKYKNAPNPTLLKFTENHVNDLKEHLKKQGRLNNDGTLSLYHVTTTDNIPHILKHGLIPAKEKSIGQTWKAFHSNYATYFHSKPEYAKNDEKNSEGHAKTIEARIPINVKTYSRFLPDEDFSKNEKEGIKTLKEGGPVAFIGGVPAKHLNIYKHK